MVFERKKVGEILVEMGAVAPAQVKLILDRMVVEGSRFGETGIAEGLFNEDELAEGLAKQFDLPYVDLALEEIAQGKLVLEIDD